MCTMASHTVQDNEKPDCTVIILDLFLICYVVSDCKYVLSVHVNRDIRSVSGTRCKPPIQDPSEIATEFSPLNLSCADFPKQMILYDVDQI